MFANEKSYDDDLLGNFIGMRTDKKCLSAGQVSEHKLVANIGNQLRYVHFDSWVALCATICLRKNQRKATSGLILPRAHHQASSVHSIL